MQLLFVDEAVPRTTTRTEWHTLYRWKRRTERRLARATERQLANLAAFGTTHPEAWRIADDIVNPPLIVYPWPAL